MYHSLQYGHLIAAGRNGFAAASRAAFVSLFTLFLNILVSNLPQSSSNHALDLVEHPSIISWVSWPRLIASL